MNITRSSRASTALVLLVLVVSGCGGAPDDQPELADVTGQVTLDGAPVPWASVSFQPDTGTGGASGSTDINGNFALSYSKSMGSPLGTHRVEISTRREIQDEFGGVMGMKPETIPERYRGRETELTVTADDEHHFVFALTSE